MKKIIIVCLLISVFAACKNNSSSTTTLDKDSTTIPDKDHTDAKLDTIPQTGTDETADVTDDEMKDDATFDDGSVPTSWENAGVTNVRALKTFVKKVQTWVANDNKDSLASNIDYPLHNNAKIKDAESFLNNYNSLITEELKTQLQNQKLTQIFRNSQGVMVGNIWIADVTEDGSGNFKIISINK